MLRPQHLVLQYNVVHTGVSSEVKNGQAVIKAVAQLEELIHRSGTVKLALQLLVVVFILQRLFNLLPLLLQSRQELLPGALGKSKQTDRSLLGQRLSVLFLLKMQKIYGLQKPGSVWCPKKQPVLF